MKFKTSTYIVPLVDVGTYWGQLQYDSLWGAEEESAREDGLVVCYDYDHAKFGDVVVKEATKMFADDVPLADFGVKSVVATEFISPREYNFCDDALGLEVEVGDDFLERAKKYILDQANRDKVKEYIADNWKSRDGFSSHMPATDIDELLLLFDELEADDRLKVDEYRDYGSIMALLWFLHGGLIDGDDIDAECGYRGYSYDLMDRIESNYTLEDFATILDKDEVKELYGDHMVDYDEIALAIRSDAQKYYSCDVPEESKDRCRRYVDKVKGRIQYYADRQMDLIASFHDTPYKVWDYLDELKSEFDKERNTWQGLWK